MIDSATDQQRQHFQDEGYVVVRDAIDPDAIASAVAAVDRILDRAAAGEFGDEFRWTHEGERVPAFVADLYSTGKFDRSLVDLLEEVMLPYAESLLGKSIRCSWLLMLTGGAGEPYCVPLHRDNNELGGDNEAELLDLYNMNQCYFQAPLLPSDRFLQVVPGSHLRLANERERSIARSNDGSLDVDGLITIELEPGDVIYRQTNLIHQGWNPEGLRRWTLVSGFWTTDLPLQAIEIQDHAAISEPGFLDRLPPRCRQAASHFLDAYEQKFAANA